jgi:cytochrome c-type biogenesis protein CcmH
MGRRAGRLAVAAALLAAAVALAIVAARGPAPHSTPDERVRAVASTLRCPVCQNLSVADSSSRLAYEMRAEIARELQAGRSPEQIRDRFVAAYGEWVLLSPPRSGIGWIPWLAPLLLFAGGVTAAATAIRRWTMDAASPSLTPPGDHLDPEDRALLERSVSGEPGEQE